MDGLFRNMLCWICVMFFPPLALLIAVLVGFSIWFRRRFIFTCCQPKKMFTIAFLHPACAAGGGGEGVLWTAIAALQKCETLSKRVDKIVIYSDSKSPVSSVQALVQRVKDQFGIEVSDKSLEIVPLRTSNLALRPESIPFLTLLFQAFFSAVLAFEALMKHQPNILLDTTGLTFALPVFSWMLGIHCKIGAYVHYPWISTNMIRVVADQTETFNNRPIIARSSFLTSAKLYYYRILASAYAYAGGCAEVAMVNSLWTRDHVSEIWKNFPGYNLHVVYPPVNVTPFLTAKLSRHNYRVTAVFVAQFRPEKNHSFLLESYAIFLNSLREGRDPPRQRFLLKLIGGCRSPDDHERLEGLRKLCDKLTITENVQFCVGLPHGDLVEALVTAQAAVHPMINEHFGIAVVEAMAAGLIVIAHESGGPARDILLPPDNNPKQPTGILVSKGCLDKDAFAGALRRALVEMSDSERQAMSTAARQVAEQRFSSKRFNEAFLASIKHLF